MLKGHVALAAVICGAAAFFDVATAHAMDVTSVSVTANGYGDQLIRIDGSGLKDSGHTVMTLGSVRLVLELESAGELLARCPGTPGTCPKLGENLTVQTFSGDTRPIETSALSLTFSPTTSTAAKDLPPQASTPTFVSGDYGTAVCARSVTPASGACPSGYTAIGIAEISYGDATSCQSDSHGDVPLVKVRPLCAKSGLQ